MKDVQDEIKAHAKAFLKSEFNISYESIHIILDQKTLIIRVDNFLCPAEAKTGTDKEDAVLIQEMYSRLFDQSKGPFLTKINQVISPKYVASVRTGLDFETRICLLTFILEQKDP